MSKFCFHNRKSTTVLAGVQGNVLYGLFWIQRQEAALTAFGTEYKSASYAQELHLQEFAEFAAMAQCAPKTAMVGKGSQRLSLEVRKKRKHGKDRYDGREWLYGLHNSTVV